MVFITPGCIKSITRGVQEVSSESEPYPKVCGDQPLNCVEEFKKRTSSENGMTYS